LAVRVGAPGVDFVVLREEEAMVLARDDFGGFHADESDDGLRLRGEDDPVLEVHHILKVFNFLFSLVLNRDV
jgi:hypothetical protein